MCRVHSIFFGEIAYPILKLLGKMGEHVAIQVLTKSNVEMSLTRSSSFSCWVFPGGSLLGEISLRNELLKYNFTKSVESVEPE